MKYEIVELLQGKIAINKNSLTEMPDNINVFSFRYKNIIKFGEVENSYLSECRKIVASTFFIDKDIPMWENENKNEKIKKLASFYSNNLPANFTDYTYENGVIYGFTEGCKKNIENLYTKKDLINAQQAILFNHKDAIMNDNYIIEFLENENSQFKEKEVEYQIEYDNGELSREIGIKNIIVTSIDQTGQKWCELK
jgi:hypothetical protein